jgi:hypothetical protein
MQRRKYDRDICFSEALKYKTRSEFYNGSRWAYLSLNHRGLIDKSCSHMKLSPLYSLTRWTEESALKEAAKYQSRAEFKRECAGAHRFAIVNKILEQACSHMTEGIRKWHIFDLAACAIKCETRSEFRKRYQSAFGFSAKHGLIELICAHMTKRRSWTKDAVLIEAKKSRLRGEFLTSSAGAYKHADKYGYMDEACAHMDVPEYGFQKEKQAILYYLRLVIPGRPDLFKIGITNRDAESRIAGMGLVAGMRADVLKLTTFKCGRDARIAEKELHKRFAKFKYVGAPVMKNGNTELFIVDVLGS